MLRILRKKLILTERTLKTLTNGNHCAQYQYRFQSTVSSNDSTLNTIKSYEDIPGPSELPIFGSLISFIRTTGGYHMFSYNLHEKYGDIVRYSLLGRKNISIRRADHIKEVYVSNQSSPLREALVPWKNAREAINMPMGVTMELSQLFQDENEWRKFRRPVAKLLRPELVASYLPRVSHIGMDFTNALRNTNQNELKVSDVKVLTLQYGFEAIAAILMGKSMGLLGKKKLRYLFFTCDTNVQKYMVHILHIHLSNFHTLIIRQSPLLYTVNIVNIFYSSKQNHAHD